MSGTIIERRDQVLIGRLLLVWTARSTLFIRCVSTKGPFLTERGNALNPQYHVLRSLVVTRLVTFRRHAPRRYRMSSACRSTFTAAVWMVDRIHRHTTNRRPDTPPSVRAGLTEFAQIVFVIADLADGGAAIVVDLSRLPGSQPECRIKTLTGNKLR